MGESSTPEKMRILLVEDNEHDRVAFRRALQKSEINCRISECQKAEEAFQLLQSGAQSFDVVVIDFGLPGMSGFELFKNVHEQGDHTPFLMLTGSGSEHLAVEALKAGVADYVVKDPTQGYLRLLPLVISEVVRQHEEKLARQRAEEALSKSERLHRELAKTLDTERGTLKAIIASLPVGLWIADATGKIISVNDIAQAIWRGAPCPENTQGYIVYKAWWADTGKPIAAEEMPMTRSLRGETCKNLAVEIERFDGTRGVQVMSSAPIRTSEGAITGCVAVAQDITEFKRAEEALRRREEEFRALVENAPDVISVFDQNLRRIYVNPAIQENTGHDASFVMGKSLTEAGYPDSFTQALNDTFQNVFATGHEQTVELDFEAPNGHIWLQIRCSPLLRADGSVERVMSIGRNITELKRTEDALRKARDDLEIRVRERTAELEEANKVLRHKERELRFLSNRILSAQEEERKRISRELHDSVSSSLAGIKFGLEHCLSQSQELLGPSSSSLQDLVASLSETIDETRRIMSDLRPSVLDDLGLAAAIDWLCRNFRTTYSNIYIEQLLEIDQKKIPEPLRIVIFRIIQEALQNVAKHSQAEVVELSLRDHAEGIELAIEDNGSGFIPGTILSREQGGFGLSTMQERTRLSGGFFEIKSIPGKGTRVRAIWPFD